MNNQNHPYHDDQSFWGANQNHSSNQHTVGNRQGFSGLQMSDQYQLGWFSTTRSGKIEIFWSISRFFQVHDSNDAESSVDHFDTIFIVVR